MKYSRQMKGTREKKSKRDSQEWAREESERYEVTQDADHTSNNRGRAARLRVRAGGNEPDRK
jgi:hypothetical protein